QDLISMKVAKRKREREETNQTVNVEEISSAPVQTLEPYNMEIEKTNESLQPAPSPEAGTSSRSAFKTSRTVHKPTPEEESILGQLEAYKDSTLLPREVVDKLAEELSQYEYWTTKRIWDRWYNRYKRSKKV